MPDDVLRTPADDRRRAKARALIDSAIVADALSGNVTRDQYIEFLTRAFHHVRHTPSLLMACGGRLDDAREWLRAEVAEYAREEIGHHEWILDDIAAAGGDAAAIRASAPEFHTELLVAYAYDTIMRRNPVGIFGMVYVLEGTSVRLACDVAESIQGTLRLPANAFTYLTLARRARRRAHGPFRETREPSRQSGSGVRRALRKSVLSPLYERADRHRTKVAA